MNILPWGKCCRFLSQTGKPEVIPSNFFVHRDTLELPDDGDKENEKQQALRENSRRYWMTWKCSILSTWDTEQDWKKLVLFGSFWGTLGTLGKNSYFQEIVDKWRKLQGRWVQVRTRIVTPFVPVFFAATSQIFQTSFLQKYWPPKANLALNIGIWKIRFLLLEELCL